MKKLVRDDDEGDWAIYRRAGDYWYLVFPLQSNWRNPIENISFPGYTWVELSDEEKAGFL